MKLNSRHLPFILVALMGMVEVANAFYDPGVQRWINRDPIEEEGGINLHQFAMNASVGFVDRNGLDIWVEGPSNGEPVGHLSVCVGDPLGKYDGYSFAVNGEGILEGAVYKDAKQGGDITKYKKTTPEQDKAFKEKLDAEVGKKGTYCWDDICRTYSNRKFKQSPGKETKPPKRPIPPSTNPLHDRLALCSQSSIGDPVSSCTDSSTSSSTCSK